MLTRPKLEPAIPILELHGALIQQRLVQAAVQLSVEHTNAARTPSVVMFWGLIALWPKLQHCGQRSQLLKAKTDACDCSAIQEKIIIYHIGIKQCNSNKTQKQMKSKQLKTQFSLSALFIVVTKENVPKPRYECRS